MATILIAEPDLASASILQATLEGEGHAVVSAQDGYEALSACEQTPPDMVFLAFNLPVLTGTEVCGALRNDPDYPPDLPIVLLLSEPVDPRVVARCGATETMEKNADAHTVRERVVDLLGPAAGAG